MSDTPSDASFRLDEFLIHPDLNEIEGPAGTSRVNPKAMDVLTALAEHPEAVCSKQQLLDAVWKDLFVGDEVLTTAVWELRRVLGDSARSPRFIQTVPRKGYRLLVQPMPEDSQGSAENARAAVRPGRWFALALFSIVFVVLSTAAVFTILDSDHAPGSVPKIEALAVLPIIDLGGDPRDQALADGLTDTLITALAGIDDLRVVSRTTSMSYRDRALSTAEIAAELGIDAVVEGTLNRSGDRIVLNAQLIDVRNEDHLWAETYERRFESLLDLQVEVARSVGAAISSRLDHPAPAGPAVPPAEPGDSLLRWRFRTGGEVWSTPVVVADTTVFGSRDGHLYSVAIADGLERWRLGVGDEVLTRVLILDDAVVAAAHDGTIVAAAIRDGGERWRFHMRGEMESPLVGGQGIVFAASEGGRVVALDASSGRQLWGWSGGGGIDGLAYGSGSVVASGFNGTVTVLDAITGAKLWEVKVAEWLGNPATIDREQVFVPSPEGHVIAYSLSDGTELWRSAVTAPSKIAAWRDRIVVGGEGAAIHAFDRSSGAELWLFDALGATTAPSVHDELVFAGSRDNNLYALDPWTGELRWRAQMRTWVTTAATTSAGSAIYGSLDGSVVCLEIPDTSPVVIREERDFEASPEDGDERPRTYDIVVTGEEVRRPRVRWRHRGDGPVLHAPAMTESLLLAAGHQRLFAFDLAGGEPRWSRRLPGEAGTGPVVIGDSVIIGTRDGYVVAHSVADGEERWRFATGGAVISTPAFGADNLFFGSRDGFLYAIDPDSGQERWRRQLDVIHSSPLVLGDEVWVTGRGDNLWVVAAADGRLLSTMSTADWAVADPVATMDRVLVASSDGTVEAVERSSGEVVWRVTNPGEIWYRPLAHRGRYFFGSADHHIYALETDGGREIWRRRTANRALSSVAGWRGSVMVGSHDRSLHAYRAEDGSPLWRLVTTGIMGNPAVRGDLLGVGSFDGYVYLVELD